MREECAGLQCRNCGDVVDPRRVELGYDYCLKEECQRRCLRRVRLAAVGVNKAADYYQKADEVLPPPAPAISPVDRGEPDPIRPSTARPSGRSLIRPQTTLERLQEQERKLDEALDRSYERFRRGEITAKEMDGERNRLVAAFNRSVMGENIRYRSLLRRQ
jgi:hypothetical protein